MDRNKKQNKLISIGLSLIMLLLTVGVQLGYAAEGVSMQALRDEPGTLLVKTQYTDEDKVTLISGMELTIFQVATLSVKDGDAKYSVTGDFSSVDVDFNGMTAEQSLVAAKQFADVVAANKLQGKTVVSENGVANFGEVEHGIYLVCQTGKKGDAEEYSELDPYLVMTPQRSLDDETAWVYDVESIPKLGIKNKTIKITKKVNDLDNIEVQMQTDKFAYDIEAELGYMPNTFAVVDHVPEQLEIVDKSQIEIVINDQVISNEERDAMLTIEGNDLRVDFTREQIEKWSPLKMSVNFRCKFKEGANLDDENLSVVNVAGYEVEGVYYEPPGDDNKAEVRGVNKDEPKEKTLVKSVKTGDYNNMIMWGGLVAATMILLLIVVANRRKRN